MRKINASFCEATSLASSGFASIKRTFVLACLIAGLTGQASLHGQQDAVPPQDNVVTSANMTPTPGDPRTFLTGLNESVDPATGNVSVSIQAPMPPDRGVNLPVYAWSYYSSGPAGLTPTYSLCESCTQQSKFITTTQLGLSFSVLPTYLPNSIRAENENLSTYLAVGPGSHTITCSPRTHFVYTDGAGGAHPLGLFYVNASDDKTDGCGHWGMSGGVFHGGDEYYKATMDPQTYNVAVTDLHGNLVASTAQAKPEDTNGNIGKGTGNEAQLSVTYDSNNVAKYTGLTVPGLQGSYSYTYGTAQASGANITATLISNGNGCLATASLGYAEHYNGYPILNQLTLPDGRYYSFQYDPVYGRMSQITYPTGATVKYTWQTVSNLETITTSPFLIDTTASAVACTYKYDWPAIKHREVSYDGSTVARTEDYSYSANYTNATNVLGWSSRVVTVTTTDYVSLQANGSPTVTKTVYTYTQGMQNGEPFTLGTLQTPVPAEASIQYQDGSGHTLKTVTKTWVSPKLPSAICTTLDDGSMSGVFYKYQQDTYTVYSGNPVDVAEYDYGTLGGVCARPSSGSPTRETVTTYQTFNAPAYTYGTPAIFDRPASVKRYYKGALVAETDYGYDDRALVSVTAINHDDTNYATSQTVRGNATHVTRKCLQSCPDVTSFYAWDNTGQKSWETLNNATTSYSYTDQFVSPPSTGNTNAYLTGIRHPDTYPISHRESFVYNFGSGTLEAHTFDNGTVETFQYQDPWNRVTSDTKPNGATTLTSYSDAGPQPWVQVSSPLDGSGQMVTRSNFNGMGFKTSEVLSDPEGAVTTSYGIDGFGRTFKVSNPYRGASGPTTTVQFDALGRHSQQINSDGTTRHWTYSGASTAATDERGNSTTLVHDALGRLVKVVEPEILTTTYTYDGLDDLTYADQWGSSTPGAPGSGARSRQFTYDSLSRLISAYNLESGTVCYGTVSAASGGSSSCKGSYDDAGNLSSKTDARGVVTSYTYDALNRILSKSFSDGTPTTHYAYDSTPTWGGPYWPFLQGKLAEEYTDADPSTGEKVDRTFDYDAVGHVVRVPEKLPSDSSSGGHVTTMTYDLAGNMTSLNYPNGLLVKTPYTTAGRLKSVSIAGLSSTKQFASFSYYPDGSLASTTYGNGLTETRTENDRLQSCHLKVTSGSSTFLDRSYAFTASGGGNCGDEANNNGNIWQINDALPGGPNSQAMQYDVHNRITSWDAPNFANAARHINFAYDAFGNMVSDRGYASNPGQVGALGAQPFINSSWNSSTSPWPYDSTNRLTSSTFSCAQSSSGPFYDAAGNVLCEGIWNTNARRFTWDGDSRLSRIDAQQNNNTFFKLATYLYDPSGQRVRSDIYPATTGGSQTSREYVYGNGAAIAEKDNTGAWINYLFANGKRIARLGVTAGGAGTTITGFHFQGQSTSTGSGQLDAYNNPLGYYGNGLGIGSYVIKQGDSLEWQQYTNNVDGGIKDIYFFSCGGTSSLVDQSGRSVAHSPSQNSWVKRNASLSGYVGCPIQVLSWQGTLLTPGQWDIWTVGLGVRHSDGSFTPASTVLQPNVYNYDPSGAGATVTWDTMTTKDPVVQAQSTVYTITDHLGTANLEFSDTGSLLWQGAFAPFGQEVDGAPNANRYKFTGKERDKESGLDNFGARLYSSSIGRFNSPDWSADPNPIPNSDLYDPQSLNLYGYVKNAPFSIVDENGRQATPAGVCANPIFCWFKNLLSSIGGPGTDNSTLPVPSPLSTTNLAQRDSASAADTLMFSRGTGERKQTSKPDRPTKGVRPVVKGGKVVGWTIPNNQDGKRIPKSLEWGRSKGLDELDPKWVAMGAAAGAGAATIVEIFEGLSILNEVTP